jgi:hypothetical protein
MAFLKKRMDRAQRTRARRVWWDRHGAFVRGYMAGTVATVAVLGACRAMGIV